MSSVFWASRAPAVIDSAVAVPAIDSERCTSAASDLTWLAASEDAVTSVLCASRAPAVIDFGGRGAGHRQRALHVGGQRFDLVGGLGRCRHQRALRIAGAGGDRFRGGVPAIDSERSTSAASDLTWLAASADAVTSVVWASRAPDRTEAAVALPAAESVRSTSADSDLIWLGGFAGGGDQRRLGIAGAGQDRVGGAGADRGEGAFRLRPRSAATGRRHRRTPSAAPAGRRARRSGWSRWC